MESDKLFIELNGTKVTRERIGEIIEIAKTENNTSVIFRLFKILNDNPYQTYFEIESLKEYPKALNGAQHQGIYKVALDNCGRLMPGFMYKDGLVVRTTTGDKYFRPNAKKNTKKVAEKPIEIEEKPAKTPVSKDQKKTNAAEVKKETPVLAKDKKTQAKKEMAEIQEKEKVSESQSNKKLTKEDLEKANPKSYNTKPASVSVVNAIKDVSALSKFKGIKPMQSNLLYKIFKDDLDLDYYPTDFEAGVLRSLPDEFAYVNDWGVELNEKGKDFIKAISGRLESVRNQKSNYAMFDGLKGVQENISDPEIAEIVQIIKEEMPERKVIVFDNGMPQKLGSSKTGESKFFTVNGEVGKFLQQVEKKPVGSVVITIDGMQGAGKTTMLYQFMESFDSAKNNCLFISGEEDPNSHLAKSKAEKFLSENHNVLAVGEVKDVPQLYSYIEKFDIIFIDSWQKLQRMVGNIRLDEDLRKKFHGKVFVIIFQQTTTGRTKGGAEVVFDGDIIIKMIKESSFEMNYAFFDKNRYTLVPIETIRYNIASAKCYNPEAIEENENTEPINLSFTYKEN